MAVASVSTGSYQSTSTSGGFTINGLGDGTDWTDLIEASVEAESYELEKYQEDLEEAEAVSELLEALNEEILTLSGILQGIDEMDEFLAYSVSTTGDGEVQASIEDGATEDSYNLVVNQLAQKDVWISEDMSITSSDQSIISSNSSITLSYAGEEITMDVTAGTTAQELVDQINSDPDFDNKITASLISDGSNYYIKFSGEDTGADNAVVLTDLSAIDGYNASSFTNTQTAQNAQMKVDGFPSGSGNWIERPSNTVDDVIDNMTLTLNAVTDESGINVGVSYDTDAMIETIETFVSEVNQLLYDLLDVTGELADEDDDGSTVYIKDATLGLVYDSVKDALTSAGLGFLYYDSETGKGDMYASLSAIGITTDSTEGSSTFGQLEIDYDELEDALAADPEAVAMLFAANGEAETDSSDMRVLSTISGLTSAGDYDVEYTVSGGVITAATINGVDMTISGNTLLATRDSDANGLYLEVSDLTDGTYSSTVTVKQGKCGQLADLCSALTDVSTGSIPLLAASYDDLTSKLEGDIYAEEARLDTYRTRLEEKYSALDTMLAYYSGVESQLETTLASLDSS
ncbi:flagellar filament capping protein FliD [Maridesulfovibrio salexigens]|uniref:Flagellar hook-associated protein 2 n=1 Tax=Maridesulfovibrio salexigens (strain ATCC 14822 / DSM 2638 / NCIMB 8403 / VKM B-1763) TaxID=526222 RepID=C6BZV2_MARSD|nr:flagellar filament capping protein FliD [Maridesulfovibrio salexigens]ACS79009.1 flagellar hook-associated 2 domain protein [Maridesulfovibrio salexigens DSM 2638]